MTCSFNSDIEKTNYLYNEFYSQFVRICVPEPEKKLFFSSRIMFAGGMISNIYNHIRSKSSFTENTWTRFASSDVDVFIAFNRMVNYPDTVSDSRLSAYLKTNTEVFEQINGKNNGSNYDHNFFLFDAQTSPADASFHMDGMHNLKLQFIVRTDNDDMSKILDRFDMEHCKIGLVRNPDNRTTRAIYTKESKKALMEKEIILTDKALNNAKDNLKLSTIDRINKYKRRGYRFKRDKQKIDSKILNKNLDLFSDI